MLSFDPATPGPGFFSNPYPTYRMLREQEPIHRCPDGTWFLTRHADNCVFLLNAGHETTTNLIGNALFLLPTHDDQLQRLHADPTLINSAVEESLRCESPNQLGNRLVVEPVRIAGTLLEPGAYLHLCIGAANRDPQVFPGPDRFDVARTPNPHLAFAAGAHACAGMSVARLEGQVAIQHIVRRFPQLRLHGEPVRGARARFRGFSVLPLATH
jgi:cytochrome P450